MKTLQLFTAFFAFSGMLFAQTPAFVSDWEGAPDKMKIIQNDNNEYVNLRTSENVKPKSPVDTLIKVQKKVLPTPSKKLASRSKKKLRAKPSPSSN